jgi:hypothetical protein
MKNKFNVAVMLDVDGTIAPFYKDNGQPCQELRRWHEVLVSTLQRSSHVSINTGRSRSEINKDKNLHYLADKVNWSIIACSGGSGIYVEASYISINELQKHYDFNQKDSIAFGRKKFVRLNNGACDEDAFAQLRTAVQNFLIDYQVDYPPQAQDSLKICISTDSPESAEKLRILLDNEFEHLIRHGIYLAVNKNFIDITLGSKASSFEKISEIISNTENKNLPIVYCGDASNDRPVRDIILNHPTQSMFFVNQNSGHDPEFYRQNIDFSYGNQRIIIPRDPKAHYVSQVICGISQAYQKLEKCL